MANLHFVLCNVHNSSSDKQTIALVQGQSIVQPKQQDIKINNTETWTGASIIFTSIYNSVHAAQLQDLLKYMQTMKVGAKPSFGLNWKLYDEQFRLIAQSKGSNNFMGGGGGWT